MTESWISPAGQSSLVSVIIPTFNRSELLNQAIQSVFDQKYRPIECVVVDDGSTDDTHEILESWQSQCNENFALQYLRQKNAGASSARNRGTRKSRGEFIQYLDSDDLLYPNKLANQVSVLNRFRNVDGIFGDWEVGSTNEREFVKASRDKDLIAQFLGRQCISVFSFLMRRSVISKIGPWDEQLRREEEIDFHLRAVLAGGRFVYKNVNCGLWRVHQGERVSVDSGKPGVLAFRKKWVDYLKSLDELTYARSRAISNGLFYKALPERCSERSLVLDMLSLSWELNPDRPEFQTLKMRVASSTLGKRLALRIWLARAKKAWQKK